MIPLYEDPYFTFHFADDRIISRIHLESAPTGREISIYMMDPKTGEHLNLRATGIVGDEGWVNLSTPIIVRAGEAFIAI